MFRKDGSKMFKKLLGYCDCKDCKNKYDFAMSIEVIKKNGKKKNIKKRLCQSHFEELIKNSKINSITFQQRINFRQGE